MQTNRRTSHGRTKTEYRPQRPHQPSSPRWTRRKFPQDRRSTLDEEFEQWRNRPLPENSHLFLDATYHKVRLSGNVRDGATLLAIGIQRESGKRIVLDVSCALSEAEVHWRGFLTGLKERGIGLPDLVVSYAHEDLCAALRSTMNASPSQR